MIKVYYNLLTAFIICVATMLTAIKSATAQESVNFEGFRMRGNDENGETNWELHGEHAQVDGTTIEIQNFTIFFTMSDGSRTILTSPECSFNKTTRIGKSRAPIQVVGDNITVNGVGYDLLADQNKLFIRNNVEMLIQNDSGIMSLSTGMHDEKKSTTATELLP